MGLSLGACRALFEAVVDAGIARSRYFLNGNLRRPRDEKILARDFTQRHFYVDCRQTLLAQPEDAVATATAADREKL